MLFAGGIFKQEPWGLQYFSWAEELTLSENIQLEWTDLGLRLRFGRTILFAPLFPKFYGMGSPSFTSTPGLVISLNFGIVMVSVCSLQDMMAGSMKLPTEMNLNFKFISWNELVSLVNFRWSQFLLLKLKKTWCTSERKHSDLQQGKVCFT